MTDLSLVQKVAPLDAWATHAELEEAERAYIAKHIQPWVERHHADSKRNESVERFDVLGSGLNKRIAWSFSAGVECEGCDGDGRISSAKGTRTDCPDCWGSGFESFGETRTVVTDYDGNPMQRAA